MFKIKSFFTTLIICLLLSYCSGAQGISMPKSSTNSESQTPQKYIIDTVNISGAYFLDADILRLNTGLAKGDKIFLENDPEIAKAIKTLWNLKMFQDVKIIIDKIKGDSVSLNVIIVERPRLSKIIFKGIGKTAETEIKNKINIKDNRMLTEAFKIEVEEASRKYFAEKGYRNLQVNVQEETDTSQVNSKALTIYIEKGNKVHINAINIMGNENVSDAKIKSKMKGTKEMARLSLYPANENYVYGKSKPSLKSYFKQFGFLSPSKTLERLNPYFRYNIFASSKLNNQKFQEDKENIISLYNSLGYRDAQIVADTNYIVENGNLNVDLKIREGKRYYFGDIQWKGNTKYSDSVLSKILNIKKGDIYNRDLLLGKMGSMPSMDGSLDIGSLYMDDGYLFFQVTPKEKSVVNDTINYEIAIQEGPQATIKNITISGNERTNEHVIRRELFTLPGNKFSRTDIIRSIRQISNLGFIDPEKVNPIPKPNYDDGTVDIDYNIVEKSSDQLELSAGFGGGIGFTGTLGVVFNNFSIRNIARFKNWDPLPMGDGQKLSIRYQSNGLWFNSANLSFTEPWLGGKKPIGLTVSAIYGRQSYSENGIYNGGNPNDHYLRNFGGGVSLSKRLNWPDNNFLLSFGLNYQNYFLKDYTYFVSDFKNGPANNLFFRLTLARNSVDQPIYPRSGSNINFTFQFTPPYSIFSDKNYENMEAKDKYRWIEYHKYRFTAEWYQSIAGNLVLKLAAKYGFLGYYNNTIGYSPFERFSVGGDGLSGFNMFVGKDIISHRGYETGYSDMTNNPITDATIFNKYTAEVRYPFSLNPSATIFGLAFVEAANGWYNFSEYNPFKLYRSAGLGVRIHLPMFGLLGLDYGVGIDKLGTGTKFGGAAKFSFMLGFEPD